MRVLRRDRAAEAEDAPERKSDREYWPHGFLEAVLERLATVFAEIEVEQGSEVIYPAWAVWRLTAIEVIKEAGLTKPEVIIAAGALLASVLEEEDQLLTGTSETCFRGTISKNSSIRSSRLLEVLTECSSGTRGPYPHNDLVVPASPCCAHTHRPPLRRPA